MGLVFWSMGSHIILLVKIQVHDVENHHYVCSSLILFVSDGTVMCEELSNTLHYNIRGDYDVPTRLGVTLIAETFSWLTSAFAIPM